MPDVETAPPPIILKYRTRLASIWLARSRATASPTMKLMIGGNSITVHSAGSAELLLRFDWSDELILVETTEPNRRHEFADLEASLTFIDAVMFNWVDALSELGSLAPAFLRDDVFWQGNSAHELTAEKAQPIQKSKSRRAGRTTIPLATAMDTAAMESWVGAWAL